MSRLADRLRQERRRRFVGRSAERELFTGALAAAALPFCLLWIYGPGGVGKSTLLKALADLAEGAGCRTIALDAAAWEASPEAFCTALGQALGSEQPLGFLSAQSERWVLFFDSAEQLAALDGWLRETFLPQLPDNTLVVLAGRQPPGRLWRSDPGWQSLMRVISLRNFSPTESRAYLELRQVPDAEHAAILAFTHGHPLALSLVADLYAQGHSGPFDAEREPDVIRLLLACFADEAPTPLHRQALEACALVHRTDEALLGRLLALPEAGALFDWLCGLSFIEPTAGGLVPHELAREVLAADLRWRHRERYVELHDRARRHYQGQLAAGSPDALFDYIWLHRDNPIIRPLFAWRQKTTLQPDRLRPEDLPQLVAMVERFEGPSAAALCRFWLERQPERTVVVRDSEGNPQGFVLMLALEQTSIEDREQDPAASAAWRYLALRSPLRPGEKATHFRFWMAADTYHGPSAAQSLVLTSIVRHYLSEVGLAFSFFPVRRPEHWQSTLAYTDLERLAEADYTVDGQLFGVFGHDWRVRPSTAWLAVLAEREVGIEAPPSAATRPALLVLSAEDFATAVRQALRDLNRADRLATNPLVRSRLVLEASEAHSEAPAAALRRLIEQTAAQLRDAPREHKFYRALALTYIEPADSQEQAAEKLDLPFSTYRRHLQNGIERVVELLWRRELQGS